MVNVPNVIPGSDEASKSGITVPPEPVESPGGGTVESEVAESGVVTAVSAGGVELVSLGAVGTVTAESMGSAASEESAVSSLPHPAPIRTNTRRLPSNARGRRLNWGEVEGSIMSVASP